MLGCRPAIAVAMGLVVTAALAACQGSTAPPVAPPRPSHTSGLRTGSWALTGTVLSVLVRNTGDTTVGSARAIITARDERGDVVGTVSGSAADVCCLITGLAPGASFVVTADLGSAAPRVATVSASFADVVDDSVPPVQPHVSDIGLSTGSGGTVVTAVVTSPPGVSALAVQAVLVRQSGELLASTTTRVGCLSGTARTVRLPVGIRLPEGALVRSVTTYSMGALAPAATDGAQCSQGQTSQPRGAPKSSPSGRRPVLSPSG